MTTNDIKQVQILLTDNEGHNYISVKGADNIILLNFIVELCQFAKVKDDLCETIQLKELIEN